MGTVQLSETPPEEAMRRCLGCSTLIPSGSRCTSCRIAFEAKRWNRPERLAKKRSLYDRQHRAERAEWARAVAYGNVVCARCHELIGPCTPWQLGHQVGGPSHPEHRYCNEAAGARGEG